MNKSSRDVKHSVEKAIINIFLKHYQKWILKEHPIDSIKQNQLGRRDAIPDAIIYNEEQGLRVFLEITTASRSDQQLKSLGKQRKGIDEGIRVKTILLSKSDLVKHISMRIHEKSKKNYKSFCKFAQLNEGFLVVYLDLEDPFHNEKEFGNVVESFKDEHILFSLGLQNSQFKNVYLSSYVLNKSGKWKYMVTLLADENMIHHLSKRQQVKDEILQNI